MKATEFEDGEKYVPAPDATWQRNAPSQIVLDSIFAALTGVLLVFSVQDGSPGTWHRFFELTFSLFSFLLFARSAEGTTNALDEKDVRQYVYYLLWYNLAVIFLVVAIAILVYAYFSSHFFSFLHRHLSLLSTCELQASIALVFVFLFLAILKCWIRDFLWIIRAGREEFGAYLDELEDRKKPKPEPSYLFNLWYGCTKQ